MKIEIEARYNPETEEVDVFVGRAEAMSIPCTISTSMTGEEHAICWSIADWLFDVNRAAEVVKAASKGTR